jgi:hypothetical protein
MQHLIPLTGNALVDTAVLSSSEVTRGHFATTVRHDSLGALR